MPQAAPLHLLTFVPAGHRPCYVKNEKKRTQILPQVLQPKFLFVALGKTDTQN